MDGLKARANERVSKVSLGGIMKADGHDYALPTG